MTVRIARYHNVFGPLGSWNNDREKAPAALCRKVALADPDGAVEIWGDGPQSRSFLYVDECIEGTIRLKRKWINDVGSDPVAVFPGHGQMKPEQLEMARLRREVVKLKAERDILKKAATYFAKDSL